MKYTVYVLRCSNGAFHVNITTNLTRALYELRKGTNRRSFAYRRKGQELVFSRSFDRFEDADSMSIKLRRLTHAQKEFEFLGNINLAA